LLPVIIVLICFPGFLLTSPNSFAARIVTAVMGVGAGSLFLIMGLYALSAGVSLFYQRIGTTTFGAFFGLSAGLFFGSFTSIIGIAGAIAILRHSFHL
jgi:hypothetical protein